MTFTAEVEASTQWYFTMMCYKLGSEEDLSLELEFDENAVMVGNITRGNSVDYIPDASYFNCEEYIMTYNTASWIKNLSDTFSFLNSTYFAFYACTSDGMNSAELQLTNCNETLRAKKSYSVPEWASWSYKKATSAPSEWTIKFDGYSVGYIWWISFCCADVDIRASIDKVRSVNDWE
ncbi:MAG: hypothetical protein CVT48_04020 [Thermoplasmata archaeon HGW-Thermoplasmata-1]|nr:MAG: hypothetical protein CVT48_04020 [Thermoplasmata archaeon HGW-Thermoplasmata-1]